MGKLNHTASEAQLKARRTSLGKKTVDKLITIILRKDKSERSLNRKIQELTSVITKREDNTNYIIELKKELISANENIKTKREQLDNLEHNVKSLRSDFKGLVAKVNNVKTLLKIHRTFNVVLLIVIAILLILCL